MTRTATLGPHPDLDGIVALDLAEISNRNLQEALTLAWENGYWIVEREEHDLGTILHLESYN